MWRDTANRDNASKVVAMTTLWDKLTHAKVLGEFDRDEINVDDSALTREANISCDHLFLEPSNRVECGEQASKEEYEKVMEENKWLEEFDGILKDEGKAFNPESEQLMTAELRLLRTLHENNLWHRANDAWQTHLLPVGSLVKVCQVAYPLWVLKTNECAALCWPGHQQELHMWRQANEVKELEWYTCFNLDDVKVLELHVLSPQSLMLQDCLIYAYIRILIIKEICKLNAQPLACKRTSKDVHYLLSESTLTDKSRTKYCFGDKPARSDDKSARHRPDKLVTIVLQHNFRREVRKDTKTVQH